MTLAEIEVEARAAFMQAIIRGVCKDTVEDWRAWLAGWQANVLRRTLEQVTLLEAHVKSLESDVQALETDHAHRYDASCN